MHACSQYDPTCNTQTPLTGNDAYFYDPAGQRLIVEVGSKSRVITSAAPDNSSGADGDSAWQVRMALVGSDGMPLDQRLPLGCTQANGCVSSSGPTVTAVDCGGTYAFSLNEVAQTAVFRIPTSISGTVTLDSCPSAPTSMPTTPVGVTLATGAFPLSHAYYGGNVGVSGGDAATFTNSTLATGSIANCGKLTVYLPGGGVPAWAVVGSPNEYRGSAISGSLRVTCPGTAASSLPRSYNPYVQVTSAMCSSSTHQGRYTYTGVIANGQPQYALGTTGYYLRWSPAWSKWIVAGSANPADNGAWCQLPATTADYSAAAFGECWQPKRAAHRRVISDSCDP